LFLYLFFFRLIYPPPPHHLTQISVGFCAFFPLFFPRNWRATASLIKSPATFALPFFIRAPLLLPRCTRGLGIVPRFKETTIQDLNLALFFDGRTHRIYAPRPFLASEYSQYFQGRLSRGGPLRGVCSVDAFPLRLICWTSHFSRSATPPGHYSVLVSERRKVRPFPCLS